MRIYSRSADSWFDGKVTEVIAHKLANGRRGSRSDEWLVVKYKNGKKTKRIQRNCPDVKPIPNDSILSLRCGSQCLIYSKKFEIWLQGEVLRVFSCVLSLFCFSTDFYMIFVGVISNICISSKMYHVPF